MKYVIAGMLILASFLPITAFAADTCAWFRSEAVPGDWWIVHGKCEMTMTGDKFTALLYDSDKPKFLRVKVWGTIQGSQVHASIETENSDAGVDTFDGTLTKNALYKNVLLLTIGGLDTVGIKFGPN